MDFRQSIKQLRKDFFKLMKDYYKDKHLVAKLIFKREQYNNIYECDLMFSVCMLNGFCDDNISKLCNKNINKAIELFIQRSRACVYLILIINAIIEDDIIKCKENDMFIKGLQEIKLELHKLINKSIENSNKLAKSNGLPLFDISEFNF